MAKTSDVAGVPTRRVEPAKRAPWWCLVLLSYLTGHAAAGTDARPWQTLGKLRPRPRPPVPPPPSTATPPGDTRPMPVVKPKASP